MSHVLPRRALLTGGATFVVSDALTFVALLWAAAWFRHQALEWPGAHPSWALLGGLTVLLFGASALLQIGRPAALFGVVLLGLCFVGGEAWEWRELVRHGEGPSADLRHASLFVVTGLHAIHVVCGVAYALRVALARRTSSILPLYWGALDLAWVGIVVVVYL
ncbi:MAG: hypothetical protein ABI321_21760 [Polyangia bacterium]